MRFARIGSPGAERPAVLAGDGTWRDLSAVTSDIDGAFLASGMGSVDPDALPEADGGRFGSPIVRPGKVVGIGLNYSSYAAALGVAPPTSLVVFLKPSSSVTGPEDPIRPMRGATTTDYEVELGVVIGRSLFEANPDEAVAAVAGYVLADDVTDRERIANSPGPWAAGKSADTYTPIGPWLVTPDEVGDTAAVQLKLTVDGDPRQNASTAEMAFGVPEILAHLSTLMTLEPGDLVLTGTPAGTAVTLPEPKPYLRGGQVVEADGGVLGRQRNVVVE